MCNVDEARELFALAGLTAESTFTKFVEPEVQLAMQEEREAFACFVRDVPLASLDAVESLPFARVLPTAEADQVWDAVERAWGLSRRRYWYPLARVARTDVEAFQEEDFLCAIPPEQMAAPLFERGIRRVWELREYGPEYERDASSWEPRYNGAEGFWTSAALDWILYASHENSITIGGWMLAEIKQAWPEWGRHVWIPQAPR